MTLRHLRIIDLCNNNNVDDEVVERITLTWEHVDVYAPPTRSKPILLRCLGASSADVDSVGARHILKDGTAYIREDLHGQIKEWARWAPRSLPLK